MYVPKTFLLLILWGILGIFPFLNHQAWGNIKGTLSEPAYLQLLLERNENIQGLRKKVEAQLYSLRGELASQRPSLGISGTVSRWLNHDRGDRYADLSLSQRMDLAGRYGLQEKNLLLGLQILECQYADSVNTLLARGAKAYRKTVMAGLNTAMMEEVVHHREESLKVTEEKFHKELVPLLDLLRAQSQVDEGKALLLQARQTWEQQRIEMRSLAGQVPVTPRMEAPKLEGQTPETDLARAWETRGDVGALVLGVAQAETQHRLAARGLAPFIDFSLGWRMGEDYRSSYMEDQQGEFLAKAVLSIPLADGSKTANTAEAARLLTEKAVRDLEAKKDAVQQELDLVTERWERGLEMETLRRRQMERAQKELEIAEMLYREGLASQLDLINAQERDQQSRTNHLSAVQELWVVLAEANRAMGRYGKENPSLDED